MTVFPKEDLLPVALAPAPTETSMMKEAHKMSITEAEVAEEEEVAEAVVDVVDFTVDVVIAVDVAAVDVVDAVVVEDAVDIDEAMKDQNIANNLLQMKPSPCCSRQTTRKQTPFIQ